MKVNGFRELIPVARPLKPQTEGGDGYGAAGYEQQNQKSDQDSEQKEPEGMTPEQERVAIEKAVAEFEKESQSQQHGLHASIIPGLRVVLTDVNGTVIRQLAPQDFLKLRQGVAGDSRGRGKLLDQKY
ncbi:MAG: hypothetical protein KGQ59_07480 [Bdellovibrionales bacterium]|nr:hypothetical protein [Bdellovibrionales bacterium]